MAQKKEEETFKTLYREIGYYLNRLEHYERALTFFDEAVRRAPEDKRALMGRAWARSKACKYQGAIEDVKKALKLDEEDLLLLANKALFSYFSCEFEDALVQNARSAFKRSKPDNFKMGIMHCKDAIENCIGDRAGRPLRDHYKIIRRLAWKKNRENKEKTYIPKGKILKLKKEKAAGKAKADIVIQKKKNVRAVSKKESEILSTNSVGTVSLCGDDTSLKDSLASHTSDQDVIPPCPLEFPYKPLQNYTKNLEITMAAKYLDKMYLDKLFLKELPDKQGINTPNNKGTEKIIKAAKAGYKMVDYNQELLRTRRPYYLIKYQEAKSSGQLLARQNDDLKKLQVSAKKEADQILKNLEQALESNNLKQIVDLSDKMKSYCESKTKKVLPERDEYLNKMYNNVCDAYYQAKIVKEDFPWFQERRATVILGIPGSSEPSNDSLYEQFKGQIIDWKKQCSTYEERVRESTNPEELAWLYFELGRFKFELRQYEMARVYSRKGMTEANSIGNLKWLVNGLLFIAKVNIAQRNKNDAKNEIKNAMAICDKLGDPKLEKFLDACISVIEKAPFDDRTSKVLEMREKKIIDMMSGSKKNEVAHLFRRMSAMPANRRMSVMPGVRAEQPTTRALPPPIAESEENIVKKEKKDKKRGSSSGTGGRGVGFAEVIDFNE